jgi:hypothetical protein
MGRGVETKALRIIFGLKMEEIAGSWRKLHYEDIHNSSSSRNTIRDVK